MPEIAVADLDPRWQAQVDKLKKAVEADDAEFAIAVAERLLEEFPGCLEVRRLLRSAQRRRARRYTTGFARWLGGVGVQLRSGGLYRKNPAKALVEAESALHRDPDNAAAHRLLGAAALELDLPATAVFAFSAVRSLEPTDRSNLLALGAALIKADQADEAIRLAEEMLTCEGSDAEAEALLKDASVAHSLKEGNWEQVDRYRGKRAPLAEADARGTSLRQGGCGGNLRERAARLEQAIASSPDDLRSYQELADIWRQLEEPFPALEWIERAVALPAGAHDPALQQLRSDLRLEVLRKRLNTCRAQAESRPEDAVARADLEAAEGELHAFERERLAQLVEHYPHEPSHRLAYGRALLDEGEAEQAAMHFQRALEAPRERSLALLGLGRAFKLQSRYDLALQQFAKALEESTVVDEQRIALLYERADTAQLLGRDDEARQALEAIYEVDVGYRDVAARLDRLDHQGTT